MKKSHAEILRNLRLELGKTRPVFADYIGVTESVVKNIETGRTNISESVYSRLFEKGMRIDQDLYLSSGKDDFPKIEVPANIIEFWDVVLSENFIDKFSNKKEVWVFHSKWRDITKEITYEDYSAEFSFYRGTEHYLMGYLQYIVAYLKGDIPRAEVNRRRLRTREVICNGRYPHLDEIVFEH